MAKNCRQLDRQQVTAYNIGKVTSNDVTGLMDWSFSMRNLFEHTSAPWIRYSGYEYKTGSDGNLYITVSEGAKPEMYHPMQEARHRKKN